jgi:hypothetical protein
MDERAAPGEFLEQLAADSYQRLAAALAMTIGAPAASAQARRKPGTELACANGTTVAITTAHFNTAPSLQQLAAALALYRAAYSVPPWPPGYRPQPNPVPAHPGLPTGFGYQHHVPADTRALGNPSAPRHLVLLLDSLDLLRRGSTCYEIDVDSLSSPLRSQRTHGRDTPIDLRVRIDKRNDKTTAGGCHAR